MKLAFLIVLCGGLVSSTAFAGITLLGSNVHSRLATPGDVLEGDIALRNPDKQPVNVTVAQTDYLCFADGRNLFDEPGKNARSNASWITVRPSRLQLLPGQTATVHYRCEVPKGQELSGTYWSLLLIEPSAVQGGPGDSAKPGVGVQTVVRYGVHMITELGDRGRMDARILDKQIVRKEGQRLFQLDLENTGTRVLTPNVTLELFDATGASAGKFNALSFRLYPTCSVRNQIDLKRVEKGRYSALLLIDSGDESVIGAQYELAIE